MNEHEHDHIHDENCGCGHDHEHEHHHHHDDECGCGHDHEHEHHHHHDENCGCGHDNEHEHHHHDDKCGCGHDHGHEHHHHDHDHGHEMPPPGVVTTEIHIHDGATVVSGKLVLRGEYEPVREALQTQLGAFADAVQAEGGIIGHIKASAEIKTTEMFSVTDAQAGVMVKTAPEKQCDIILAAIVFFIDDDRARELAEKALTAVRDAVK